MTVEDALTLIEAYRNAVNIPKDVSLLLGEARMIVWSASIEIARRKK